MKLFIKNMVCPRCVMAVETILKELRVPAKEVGLGYADFQQNLDDDQVNKIEERLVAIGFEILKDEKINR